MRIRHVLQTVRCLIAAIAAALACGTVFAAPRQSPPQNVPSEAPPKFQRMDPTIRPGERVPFPMLTPWVRGTQLKTFEPGKVYVFEVFTTTCSHCEEHFDLICELVRAFTPKGVTFISVTNEKAPVVQAWLQKPGKDAAVTWSVACDPGEVVTARWQNGTFRNFTPRFFVVKDGVLQWIGHPNMSEKPLQQIVDGTWDVQRERDEFTVESLMTRANALIDMVMKRCKQSGDWQPLFDALDDVIDKVPERAGMLQAQRVMAMIGPADRVDAGYAYGRALLKAYAKDARTLRALARGTLSLSAVRRRDLDFALEAAQAADAVDGGTDPKTLDALAMAHFARGDRDKAIDCMERALKLETERKFIKQYQRTLAKYRTDPAVPMPPFNPATKPAEPAPHAAGEDDGHDH